jgi:chemosensory pili system protein ChpC
MTTEFESPPNDERLATFWVPMQQKSLLVPQVAIAEVIASADLTPDSQAPDWLLGWLDWRAQSVPVLSYEIANGQMLAADASATRLAIFKVLSEGSNARFFGLRIQGIPRLLRLSDAEVRADSLAHLAPMERMAVITQLGKASIPDLDALLRLVSTLDR